MRITVIVLILLAVVSYSDSSLSQIASDRIETGYVPPVSDLEVLFDQSYLGTMDGGVECYGQSINAEDFLLTEAGRIESIEWWGLFFTGESDSFYLRIYSNDSYYQDVPGTPGELLWEVPAAVVKNTPSGGPYRTKTDLDSSDYFEAEANTVYWFSPHYNGTAYFWASLLEGGNMCISIAGGDWVHESYVGFFRLNGTSYLPLEATTWAAIKSGY